MLGLGTCALAGRPCGSLVQRSAGASTDGWDGDSGERGEGRMPKRACSGHMCTRYILFAQSEPSALIRGYWDNIAKDCLLTLVKSRLALGSPGCLFVRSFVTMPKMAEYTDK